MCELILAVLLRDLVSLIVIVAGDTDYLFAPIITFASLICWRRQCGARVESMEETAAFRALALTCCMTSDKVFNVAMSQFLHL